MSSRGPPCFLLLCCERSGGHGLFSVEIAEWYAREGEGREKTQSTEVKEWKRGGEREDHYAVFWGVWREREREKSRAKQILIKPSFYIANEYMILCGEEREKRVFFFFWCNK